MDGVSFATALPPYMRAVRNKFYNVPGVGILRASEIKEGTGGFYYGPEGRQQFSRLPLGQPFEETEYEQNPEWTGLSEDEKNKRLGNYTRTVSALMPPSNQNNNSNNNQNSMASIQSEAYSRAPSSPAAPIIKNLEYIVKPGDNLAKIGQQFGVDWKKITGYKSGNPNLIYAGEKLSIPTGTQESPTPTFTTPSPTGQGASINDVVNNSAGVASYKNPFYEQLIGQLTPIITSMGQPNPDLEKYKAQIGTFDEEVNKFSSLLSDLDARVRRGQSAESARKAPMEIVTGRQAEIARDASADRGDILASIDTATRARTSAENAYNLSANAENARLSKVSAVTGLLANLEALNAPKEKEIDTYTDKTGNRISVFYDERTGQTRKVNLGLTDPNVDTSIVEVNGRKLLVNAHTGETIKDLGAATSGSGTATERQTALEKAAIAAARTELSKPEYYGKDKYISPEVYMKHRTDYAELIGDPANFDKVFYSFLSPQERDRLGIGKESYTPSTGRNY